MTSSFKAMEYWVCVTQRHKRVLQDVFVKLEGYRRRYTIFLGSVSCLIQGCCLITKLLLIV